MPSNADLLAIKKSLSNRYLPKKSAATSRLSLFAATVSTTPAQNVVGVGVGTKFTDGKETSTKCVRFYVATKIHKGCADEEAALAWRGRRRADRCDRHRAVPPVQHGVRQQVEAAAGSAGHVDWL